MVGKLTWMWGPPLGPGVGGVAAARLWQEGEPTSPRT